MGSGTEVLQTLLIDKLIDLIIGDNQLTPFLLADVSHDKDPGVGAALTVIFTITCGFQGWIDNVVHLCGNDVAGEVAYCQQSTIIVKFTGAAFTSVSYSPFETVFDCLPVLVL